MVTMQTAVRPTSIINLPQLCWNRNSIRCLSFCEQYLKPLWHPYRSSPSIEQNSPQFTSRHCHKVLASCEMQRTHCIWYKFVLVRWWLTRDTQNPNQNVAPYWEYLINTHTYTHTHTHTHTHTITSTINKSKILFPGSYFKFKIRN